MCLMNIQFLRHYKINKYWPDIFTEEVYVLPQRCLSEKQMLNQSQLQQL